MAELVVLIPVLRRPHRVKPVLNSIRLATPGQPRILFIPDPDDEPEIAAIKKLGAEFFTLDGNYAKKINAGVRATDEPLLLFAADDLEFHPGWLEAAKAKLTKGIGVVATEDLCNGRVAAGTLATHPLVTREYTKRGTIDDPDKVLHEQYKHEFSDREFSETARFRNAFAYAPDSVVEHLHPMVNKAPMDALYAKTWDRMWQGRRVYARRCHLWGVTPEPRRGRSTRDRKRAPRRSAA